MADFNYVQPETLTQLGTQVKGSSVSRQIQEKIPNEMMEARQHFLRISNAIRPSTDSCF